MQQRVRRFIQSMASLRTLSPLQEDQVDSLAQWVEEAIRESAKGHALRPTWLTGANGVGKTHLLRKLERDLRGQGHAVSRVAVTEGGMQRLLLSTLLIDSLPADDAEGAVIPIVQSIVDRLDSTEPSIVASTVRHKYLIHPFQNILEAENALTRSNLIDWFSSWLRRGYTTPTQRNRLGLAGTLDGEGQAIAVIADLARLARAVKIFDVWFMLLDQLEELWRRDVITDGRRARFLTDLRLLVDESLEGAPIALLVAGNTTPTFNPATEVQREYNALARRFGDPISIPGLEVRDLRKFGKEYVQRLLTDDAGPKRRAFADRLEKEGTPLMRKFLGADPKAQLGPERFTSSGVLDAWRKAADELAK